MYAAVASVLLVPGPASAQDVTEAALKAAFVYNFAKFTEWPSDAVSASSPLMMCVHGDPAVADALARAVKGRMIAGHGITVSQAAPAVRGTCHVVYVSGRSADQATQIVAGLRDLPILTISDIDGFAEKGGIAQFFFERGQLRFFVHLESVTRSRLQISSRLLALATPR